jgi:anti-sigma factor RsiW
MTTGPTNPTPDGPPHDELVAYLDGELDDHRTEAVEAQISINPAIRREAEVLRKTWDLLDYLPRPQASTDFTSRTVSRLSVAALSRSAPTAPLSRHNRWRSVLRWAAAAALVALAGAAGYATHAWLSPARPVAPLPALEDDPQLLSDLRVIDNLPRYQQVEDIEYLRRLAEPEFFGDEGGR